ncbi:multidrug ABC transporter substrate-binding protein [candidate division BRC1 bacterium HGW-BRC1-1]|jgi:putative ABC transport system permease protein|nr:MAG: multidrug ABC transporter substrate-binding protein [candidate division BRC1 bacterium HGW-BRC1-1]
MIGATIILAFREIRRNPMRSILTTLGIMIGVASVIAMVTLGRSVTARITADIASMGTNLLIVAPGAERHGPVSSTASAFTMNDVVAIERESGAVDKVAPTASSSALVVCGNSNWNTTIQGSTNEFFEVRGYKFAQGEGFTETQLQAGLPVCVIGETVRRELFGQQDPVGSTVRIGTITFTVTGLTASKGKAAMGPDQDDLVVIPVVTFQRRIAGNTDINSILVSALTSAKTALAKGQVEALMRERRHIAAGQVDDFSVEDMKEMGTMLTNVTTVLTALLGAIAGVSLIVGGIGIMNIMLVSVTERTREIGIRLSIGAREREVLLQFLVEAVTLSVFGGMIGILLGIALSFGGAIAFGMPFGLKPDIVVIAILFSGAVGVGFGYVPARKASRLNPIDALRHE